MKFEEQLKQFKESLNFPKNFGVSDYNDLMKEIAARPFKQKQVK